MRSKSAAATTTSKVGTKHAKKPAKEPEAKHSRKQDTASTNLRAHAVEFDLSRMDRCALAEKYTPYVRSIAGKVKKTVAKQIDFDDLVEYGMIGLLEAADRYDPAFGANFMTFAYYRIRGAIYDGLRGMGWMSRSEYARARFEEKANEYLAQQAYTEEVDEQQQTELPTNPFEHAVQDLASAVQGLAAVYITTLDGTEGLQVKDDDSPRADDRLGLTQARELVRETIRKLSEQERQLLEMYYYHEMSLQEVGERLGLSKSWTSRLHARVIDKLHRLLGDSLGT
jgi:RNA polymerase sigma factor FliA